MKSLRAHLTEYIATRRALGTQLQEPANTLRGCIRFLGRRRAKFITIPLALEWSQQSKNVQHATWARKPSMVRQFARWLSVLEPRHRVPPPRLLNVRHRRNQPHIYSDAEIVQLMEAAAANPFACIRTACDTAMRYTCCRLVSTWARLPIGLATPALILRTSTSPLIWKQSGMRWQK